MQQNIDFLTTCPLFSGIDADDLSAMLSCLTARTLSFRKNETILQEGSPAREVGILLKGQAQLIRTDYLGNRSIIISIEPGDMFAEAFACAGVEALPVSVVATEDSEVMLIDCRRIMTSCCHACGFHSQLIYNLLKIVAGKNLIMHQKALITSQRTTKEKLMTYLLMQARQAHSPYFTIPFDRQGLADFLEVDRSGLSAEIGRLKKQGVLDSHKNSFRLLNVPEHEN